MVKATSLLYAVYICLLVSILCGALLYCATLFDRLNSYYSSNTLLYSQNQSAVNYALGNGDLTGVVEDTVQSSTQSTYNYNFYGLIKVLTVNTFTKTDTLTSLHFVGTANRNDTALWISTTSPSITYSGVVNIFGAKKIPTGYLNEKFISGEKNELVLKGPTKESREFLPQVNSQIKNVVEKKAPSVTLKSITPVQNNDYYNSFTKPTIVLKWNSPLIENISLKGNFVITHNDSLKISSTAHLEDVILKSPKIIFDSDFKGSVQAFATNELRVEPRTTFLYPSVLAVYNETERPSKIVIGENSSIAGAIILCGTPLKNIEDNSIVMNSKCTLMGDLYCSGTLMLNGVVYGTVYTNRIFSKTRSAVYENCIIDATIDCTKLPPFWVSIPFFDAKNDFYGVCKKVF